MLLIDLLGEAKSEILNLRRRNEILSAKVEVMESFMQVLHTRPAERVEQAAVDIAWQIEQEIQSQLGKR